jgi:hypothetical protein
MTSPERKRKDITDENQSSENISDGPNGPKI